MCDCDHVGSGLLACSRPFGRLGHRDTVIGENAGVCVVERNAARKGGCRPEGLTTHGC
jgi:hypothetical protein